MSQSKATHYWDNIAVSAGKFLRISAFELVQGIRKDLIPVARYCYPGIWLAIPFALKFDSALARITGFDWLELNNLARILIVTSCLLCGWVLWAVKRSFFRIRILNQLRNAFLYADLIANKKMPALIEDVEIDDQVRKLKLAANGVPLRKFQEVRESLESHLNISIIKMYEEDNDKSRINIVYTMTSLPNVAYLEDQSRYVDGTIPIGVSYEGEILAKFRDVGHILVAGQTGGGKSNFLKVATSTLCLNNKDAEVHFLDFKGGMELADLINKLGKSHPNFMPEEGTSACAKKLADIGGTVEGRLKEISSSGCSTFDEYQQKKAGEKPLDGEIVRDKKYKRVFIVIDEIAQLYARDPGVSKETLLSAREAVNRIARQGRAAAVHLVVATQKPDSMSFDQTVKSNLPAVLCFPMVSQVASISALGTKRAYELNPEVRGRAVWKFGPKFVELQTYIYN